MIPLALASEASYSKVIPTVGDVSQSRTNKSFFRDVDSSKLAVWISNRNRKYCRRQTSLRLRVNFAAEMNKGLDNDEGKGDSLPSKVEDNSETKVEAFSSPVLGGSVLAVALLLGTIAAVGGAGFVFKDQLGTLIQYFEGIVEDMGPTGYGVFVLGYAALEMLAIPAIPLTMSAGLIFGTTTGILLVSLAGTVAATGAFLVARYAIRDRVLSLVKGNKKYLAVDRAIGEDSFRVVLLLRLSPLLPFSLGNYIYGITSVKLLPYVLGSWLGMLPGTWAYVTAGSLGRTLLETGEGHGFHGGSELVSLGIGLLATLGAGSYVAKVAADAIKDVEE